jgi:hypothetical protein
MSDEDFIDQYGNRPSIALANQLKDTELYDMKRELIEATTRPREPYMDSAAAEVTRPFTITGGSFANDGMWTATGGDTKMTLSTPERLGKWEYWQLETAGGLRQFFTNKKYLMPSYGTDDLLVLGAGRGVLGFFLGKTGLNNNNGIFNNVVMAEEDQELVEYTNKVMTDTGVNNIQMVNNNGLEEPAPRTTGYDTMASKKYDVIIATLPFSSQKTGIYYINQQIRTSKKQIDKGDRWDDEGASWPFTKKRDFYDGVSKFEDKCYDENFNRHNVMFNNARKFLKPNGYLVSIHNTMASDIDTFKPMIDNAGLELVYHTIIDNGLGTNTSSRHFFMKSMLVHPTQGRDKYAMVTKLK